MQRKVEADDSECSILRHIEPPDRDLGEQVVRVWGVNTTPGLSMLCVDLYHDTWITVYVDSVEICHRRANQVLDKANILSAKISNNSLRLSKEATVKPREIISRRLGDSIGIVCET